MNQGIRVSGLHHLAYARLVLEEIRVTETIPINSLIFGVFDAI